MQILQCTSIIIIIYNNYKLPAGGLFSVNMSCQCRNSHCGDKTILQPSYLHNAISYTRKASLHLISILVTKSYSFAHFSPHFRSIPQVCFTLQLHCPQSSKAVTCKSQSTNHISKHISRQQLQAQYQFPLFSPLEFQKKMKWVLSIINKHKYSLSVS